jgi:hypothetical protein
MDTEKKRYFSTTINLKYSFNRGSYASSDELGISSIMPLSTVSGFPALQILT